MNDYIKCPAYAFDCPYYDANGNCMMYPDFNPANECEDYMLYYDEKER